MFSIFRVFCFSLYHFIPVLLAFIVLDLASSSIKRTQWLGRTSPKWPIFCPFGRKTETQSINLLLVTSTDG